MIEAPIPDDEAERLAALRELRILDTPAEERFDRITRLARALFGVPVALVSLVDARRQWFKSAAGLAVAETSRGISFCGHAIAGDEALVVENALEDPRFADNPLVLGPPHVGFYAGFPLRAGSGSKLGTLCLIDHAPRRFGNEERARLGDLAALAEAELNREVEVAAHTAAMRENFIRLVSHELRTPTTSLLGALDLLRGDVLPMGDSEELMRMAHDGATRLARVVDDITLLAALDAGAPPPPAVRIALDALVDATRGLWRERFAAAGVELATALESGLAAVAVADWLRRILALLLDNALQHAPAGSRVVIAVTRRDREQVRIEVCDTGAGIPAGHLQQMFHDFRQADASDSRPHGGFGLGLAIGRRLAVAMGGSLGYRGGADAGSCFFLDLPG